VQNPFGNNAEALTQLALIRVNASVLGALLGDAAAQGTQHQYHNQGFYAPLSALSHDGLALKDLAAALRLGPNGDKAAWMAEGPELQDKDITLGSGTNYGSHLLMALQFLLNGTRQTTSYHGFQAAWHQWQVGVPLEQRGKAAEIAVKNMERGLKGRNAATLVGDIGAIPRIPPLVAAFVISVSKELRNATTMSSRRTVLQNAEAELGRAAQELTTATHDRPEAVIAGEFLARVAFKLVFREALLPSTPQWVRHPLDRPTWPSLIWRAADTVARQQQVPFLRKAMKDAVDLCARQQRRAPLGGELGGSRRLNPEGDLSDLGSHHTRKLPTPQSSDRQRELFGLSGGVSAALPATLYLAWKYEQHLGAALTASALLGGNSAGRGVMLGLLMGALHGNNRASVPRTWLQQLQAMDPVTKILGSALRVRSSANLVPTYIPRHQLDWDAPDVSDVVTSDDVRIRAEVVEHQRSTAGDHMERHLLVRVNISNLGITGLPICQHGRLWLLWEAGGFARGRFREIGGTTGAKPLNVADRCILPRDWASFAMNISSAEPEALRYELQHMVGLLEIVRPLRGAVGRKRLEHPGVGNRIRAVLVEGQREEDCEHFAAKIGRFRLLPE